MAKTKVSAIPKGYSTATPYLCIRGALEAIAFYKKAFGATDVAKPMIGPDGKVGHAEIKIGNSILMISDENPQWGNQSPLALGGSPVTFCIYVPDVDAAFAKALAAGGKTVQPVADQFYGDRSGRLSDPYGYNWILATHKEDLTEAELKRRFDDFIAKMPDMTKSTNAKPGKPFAAPKSKAPAAISKKAKSAKGG